MAKGNELFKIQEMKPKQTLTLAASGEDEEVTLNYRIFSIVAGADAAEVHKELRKMIPQDEMNIALLEYVNRAEYQRGKNEAIGQPGKYITPSMQSWATATLKATSQFAEVPAAEVKKRWLAGVKAKVPAALKVLQMAIAAASEEEITAGF